jgi:hypothetical protein
LCSQLARKQIQSLLTSQPGQGTAANTPYHFRLVEHGMPRRERIPRCLVIAPFLTEIESCDTDLANSIRSSTTFLDPHSTLLQQTVTCLEYTSARLMDLANSLEYEHPLIHQLMLRSFHSSCLDHFGSDTTSLSDFFDEHHRHLQADPRNRIRVSNYSTTMKGLTSRGRAANAVATVWHTARSEALALSGPANHLTGNSCVGSLTWMWRNGRGWRLEEFQVMRGWEHD